MSYADVAASGPRQTPQEAAAPQPPQVVPTEAVTNASLVDVDVPTIRTVPPDFVEQDVQTGTQKKRKEREQQEEQARAEADFAKKKKKKKKSANGARTSKNVLAKFFGNMSKDTTNPIFLANVTAVVGVGTYLGYKAVGLYQRGQLTRKTIGIGAGVVAGMGLVQIMLGKYLYNGGKGGKEREKS
ncbi:hypothetical protein GGS21DRAFT_366602 [Xylaria nigripes]|nr:hypothetical protein GGS21DRAFT_366602 [Xylaria nigripes]